MILVVFLEFKESQQKEDAYKGLRSNGVNRFLQHLARIFENDFREFNLFCYSWIIYS